MSRKAQDVLTDDESIRKLESLVHELQGNSHVVVFLRDGSTCEGVVTVRPSVQVFRDHEEREGINAELQLERPDVPTWHRRIWLDQIVRIEHLDSGLASES
ncbi:MAG: DUF3247 family protein [Rhodanobacter sp.]|nr:MAG: DUF3247 family protein [Rhodanobacter sp.]TAL98174.1 MAG: DUF3247 family protein [Rhodanobacter sp.]TAM39718.1 MAG: DUF3247 family protein [Rhodanobacter sp.]